jgi:hypothetical protein
MIQTGSSRSVDPWVLGLVNQRPDGAFFIVVEWLSE